MKKSILVLAVSFLLGGCALPTSVQIASWAIDGISYLATKKSMTDHGISLVREQDCALWRMVKQEEVCVNYPDAATAIAENEETPDGGQQAIRVASLDDSVIAPSEQAEQPGQPGQVESRPQSQEPDSDDVARLAAFETAAGPAPLARNANAQDNARNIVITPAAPDRQGHHMSYQPGAFAAAWAETLKHDPKAASNLVLTPIVTAAADPDIANAAVPRFGGYAADTIASAWDRRKGTARPAVRWVMAASPAPQQESDLPEVDPVVAEVPEETTAEPQEVADIKRAEEIKLAGTEESGLENTQIDLKIEKNSSATSNEFIEREADFEIQAVEPPLVSAAAEDTKEDRTPPLRQAKTDAQSVYFVIASYGDSVSAMKGMNDYRGLNVQLVVARFDGREVYRGLVGPFARNDLERVGQRIARAGVRNAWAIRLNRSTWTFVYSAAVSQDLALRR
ncbi:MAG: hypothetical protein RIB59_15765 [Rhodospirillales bacterium]